MLSKNSLKSLRLNDLRSVGRYGILWQDSHLFNKDILNAYFDYRLSHSFYGLNTVVMKTAHIHMITQPNDLSMSRTHLAGRVNL